MTTETKSSTLPEKFSKVSQSLSASVMSVMGNTAIEGFEKAFLIASAVGEIKTLLTPEIMKPILNLQGNKLGFKTDKDDKGGYPDEVVKNCLVEAVLTGVQPFGNQFNIISSSCYITKEGFGYMLKNIPGLQYEIIPKLPRINSEKTSAAIEMQIRWTIDGKSEERVIDFPIKVNAYMGADGVIGKATRKARAWLYNTIMNTEVADGDIGEIIGENQVKTIPIEASAEVIDFDDLVNEVCAEVPRDAKTILKLQTFMKAESGMTDMAFRASLREYREARKLPSIDWGKWWIEADVTDIQAFKLFITDKK